MKFISSSLKETETLAKMFVKSLPLGSLILAYGDLGAGKTAFGKGLGVGLGIKQIINSPTFNIMKVYTNSKVNFYHVDAYRLEDKNAVSDIGIDEVINSEDGICYIEWPMYIKKYLTNSKNVYSVKIKYLTEKLREIEIVEGFIDE